MRKVKATFSPGSSIDKLNDSLNDDSIKIISPVHRGAADFFLISELNLKGNYTLVTTLGTKVPKPLADHLKNNKNLIFVGEGFPGGAKRVFDQTVNLKNKTLLLYPEGRIANGGETLSLSNSFENKVIKNFMDAGYKVTLFPLTSQGGTFLKNEDYYFGEQSRGTLHQPIDNNVLRVFMAANSDEVQTPINLLIRSIWINELNSSVFNGGHRVQGALTVKGLLNKIKEYVGFNLKTPGKESLSIFTRKYDPNEIINNETFSLKQSKQSLAEALKKINKIEDNDFKFHYSELIGENYYLPYLISQDHVFSSEKKLNSIIHKESKPFINNILNTIDKYSLSKNFKNFIKMITKYLPKSYSSQILHEMAEHESALSRQLRQGFYFAPINLKKKILKLIPKSAYLKFHESLIKHVSYIDLYEIGKIDYFTDNKIKRIVNFENKEIANEVYKNFLPEILKRNKRKIYIEMLSNNESFSPENILKYALKYSEPFESILLSKLLLKISNYVGNEFLLEIINENSLKTNVRVKEIIDILEEELQVSFNSKYFDLKIIGSNDLFYEVSAYDVKSSNKVFIQVRKKSVNYENLKNKYQYFSSMFTEPTVKSLLDETYKLFNEELFSPRSVGRVKIQCYKHLNYSQGL